ncbi:MAG: hypothetical protein KJN98_08185, partial [Pontiella sp.]|nr:hypothetical protein [Pontiella sp.]
TRWLLYLRGGPFDLTAFTHELELAGNVGATPFRAAVHDGLNDIWYVGETENTGSLFLSNLAAEQWRVLDVADLNSTTLMNPDKNPIVTPDLTQVDAIGFFINWWDGGNNRNSRPTLLKVTAVAPPPTHTITTGTDGLGGISPADAVVPAGGSANFVITANSYYRIASLATNGTAVSGLSFDNDSTATNLIWSNVEADGTLAATFTAQVASDPANTPYWWLAQYNLNNFGVDAEADPDGDHLKTWQEYIAGTDPTNAASCFKAVLDPSDTVSWDSVSGRVYSVHWSTNLVEGFLPMATNVLYPQSSYTNTNPAADAIFYQLEVHLQ